MPRLISVLLMSFVLASLASADTYLVKPDGSGDFPTILAAINGSEDGDIIELADGTFRGDGNRDIWVYDRTRTIRSQSGDPSTCIIDPEGGPGLEHRSINFQGTSSGFVLENITFSGGSAYGGGAFSYGGAMFFNEYSSPTFNGCIFENNEAEKGGAIFTLDECAPAFTNCTFANNSAVDFGGAIDLTASSNPTFTNCTFYGNSSGYRGGALTVSSSSTPTFTNCTFSGNSATDSGGAVWCEYGGAPHFIRTIIAFSTSGNAVGCDEGDCTPIFSCCNIFDNAGGDWVDCIVGLDTSNDNFSAEPLFCYRPAHNYELCSNSPCLASTSPCGELVGRYDSGCGECQTAVVTKSWGWLRTVYR